MTRRGWTQRHLLDLDALSADELALVMRTAEVMEGVLRREVKKVPTLRGRTVMTLFYEPSTRTRVSFETAGKLLSAAVVNVSVQQSSVAKGESFLDTALTLQASAADVLVVRHPHAGAPYLVARHLQRTAVVNAGDGAHAHPTQALLDLYTLQRRLGSLQGRKVVMVGDAAHSRVARSNLWGLAKLGARVTLCAPPTLVPWDLLNGREQAPDHPFRNVEVESDLRTAVRGADVLMALRIQKERQRAGLIPSLREYAEHWQVTDEVMALAGPGALLMHPGPMNEGVEVSSSVAHGAQSVIEEQVTNGLAVRMAVLFLVAAPQESQRESA
ncbi:MAG: aspartate carbamoyltransferase catalytic subunit [Dehalococcoidia bacterium]|nr:aspartate carbamoyltransferase catalytic subunit [Dehalococcoidia bacterium]